MTQRRDAVRPSGRDAFRARLTAAPDQLRPLRVSVAGWAADRGVDEATLADLQLALGEAVANAVEHAYRGGPPGTVDVMLELQPLASPAGPAAVAVRVSDAGSWRRPPVDTGHRGRGLAMIRALARNVLVHRDASGTVVTFDLPVPGAPSGR